MASLPVYRATLEPAWIDYNGHLRDAYYCLVLSYAIDDAMDHLGLDAAYRERTRCTLYTLEMHIHYLHEIKASDELQVTSSILDTDHKRMHLGSLFTCARLAEPVASADVMLLHVQQGDKPSSTPYPSSIAANIERLKLSVEAGATFGPRSRKIELKRR